MKPLTIKGILDGDRWALSINGAESTGSVMNREAGQRIMLQAVAEQTHKWRADAETEIRTRRRRRARESRA